MASSWQIVQTDSRGNIEGQHCGPFVRDRQVTLKAFPSYGSIMWYQCISRLPTSLHFMWHFVFYSSRRHCKMTSECVSMKLLTRLFLFDLNISHNTVFENKYTFWVCYFFRHITPLRCKSLTMPTCFPVFVRKNALLSETWQLIPSVAVLTIFCHEAPDSLIRTLHPGFGIHQAFQCVASVLFFEYLWVKEPD